MQTMRTRTRIPLLLMAAALCCASAGAAHAANLGFLRDTPVAALTRQDNDAIQKVVRDALDHKADGEAAQWSTAGQRRGIHVDATITPEQTSHDGNHTCRVTTVVLTARGQSMTLHPRFCREGAGDWVFQRTH